MERIEQQQTSKKAIPPVREPQAQPRPQDEVDTSAASWLSSAMAIWLRHDDAQPPGTH